MGENFLAAQAQGFKNRLDEGKRQFQTPDLLSLEHRVFEQAFTCRRFDSADFSDDLTVAIDNQDVLRVCRGNLAVGDVIDSDSAALRDAVNKCGGIIGVHVTRRSSIAETFSIVCCRESDE